MPNQIWSFAFRGPRCHLWACAVHKNSQQCYASSGRLYRGPWPWESEQSRNFYSLFFSSLNFSLFKVIYSMIFLYFFFSCTMVNLTGTPSDRSPGSLSTTASSQGSSPRFALSERGAQHDTAGKMLGWQRDSKWIFSICFLPICISINMRFCILQLHKMMNANFEEESLKKCFSWKIVGMASMARTWHLDERHRPTRKLSQVPWNRPNPP